MSKVIDIVGPPARRIAEENGCSLWDVEFVREGGDWYLRVFIDNDQGVRIDQCEQVSRGLEAELDRLDPIPHSYILEVSSAGLERTLKRPSDFEKFMGSLIEVSLYKPRDGSKTHLGHLSGFDDGTVEIDQKTRFTRGEISQVRLRIE